MLLKDLEIGKSARITTVGGQGALRQHFLDMGVVPGAEIKLMKLAPMGDPMEFRIHGYELTLRVADAEKIEIEDISYSDMSSFCAVPRVTGCSGFRERRRNASTASQSSISARSL